MVHTDEDHGVSSDRPVGHNTNPILANLKSEGELSFITTWVGIQLQTRIKNGMSLKISKQLDLIPEDRTAKSHGILPRKQRGCLHMVTRTEAQFESSLTLLCFCLCQWSYSFF